MSEEAVATAAAEEADQTQPGVETFTTQADKNEGSRKITLTWDLGKDVATMVEKFGETVIYGMAKKALIIAAQSNIRRMLAAVKDEKDGGGLKYTDEAIQKYLETEYKPGVRAAGEGGGASMDKLIAKLMKLPIEERKKLLGIE